jgi:hypothetical protein
MLLSVGLGTARAFAVSSWLHVCLAALFTYGWLRMSRFTGIAALAGAVTFSLSGFLVTWFETPFWSNSISLMPGILLFYEAALRTKKVVFLVFAAALIGATFFAGQVQFTIIFILFIGIYAFGRSWIDRQQGSRKWFFPITFFSLIALSGTLLAGAFLIPFIEFTTLSHRFVSNATPLTDRLPWRQLITLVIPDYYGNPTISSYWGEASNYSEGTIYVGVVALFLSTLTILHKKKALTKLILIITFLVFYFVLGGPGVSWLGFLPGFGFLTLHRTAFILPLFFAWLTASAMTLQLVDKRAIFVLMGLLVIVLLSALLLAPEHWQHLDRLAFRTMLWLILASTILFSQGVWPQHRAKFQLGMVLLLFADLYTWGHTYNPTGKITDLMPVTPGIALLQEQVDPSQHRVLVYQQNDQILIGMGNSLSNYAVPVAGGNSSLVSKQYLQLAIADDPEIDIGWANKGNLVAFSNPSMKLLDLLRVTHLVSAEPLPYPDVQAELLQDDCSQTVSTLHNGQPLTGEFVPQNSAINRLDVKLRNDFDNIDELTLRVNLWRNTDTPQLVLDQESVIPVSGGEETQTFFFAPETQAPGTNYLWSLQLESDTNHAVICADEEGNTAVSVYGSTWSSIYTDELYIYKRLLDLPKAYVVYSTETIPNDDQTVSRLLDEDFSISSHAITTVPALMPDRHPNPHTPVIITSYESDRISMTVTTTEPGLLILGDQYHPGWKATVDNREVPVLRVNHVMRGILLEPGSHEVVFAFKPQSLSTGLLVSSLGLLLLLSGLQVLKKLEAS